MIMSTYVPDRWIVLEFNYKGDIIRKVFAGWYGGFANGDSWKLSSGVTDVTEHEDRYEFLNHSGSTYVCYKKAYGTSTYMGSILNRFEKDVETMAGNVTMDVVEEYKQVKRDLPNLF